MELLEASPRDEYELVSEVSRRLGIHADLDLIQLALDQLRDADLLDQAEVRLDIGTGFSRRAVVRKLAAAGVAGVLIPTIASLTASRAYAQGTLLGVGSACGANGQCLSNRCCGGLCRNAACTPHNGACGAGVDPAKNTTVVDCTCCSGTCTQNGNSPDACD
jgi:hypothetical protein